MGARRVRKQGLDGLTAGGEWREREEGMGEAYEEGRGNEGRSGLRRGGAE